MEVKDIYKKYDKRVIQYMENVVKQIQMDYKNVPSSWRVSLDLVADSLQIYFKAIDDINKRGIFVQDDRGRESKNQSVAIQNVCLQNIHKLLSSFGLTPMSAKKLNALTPEDVDLYEELINP